MALEQELIGRLTVGAVNAIYESSALPYFDHEEVIRKAAELAGDRAIFRDHVEEAVFKMYRG